MAMVTVAGVPSVTGFGVTVTANAASSSSSTVTWALAGDPRRYSGGSFVVSACTATVTTLVSLAPSTSVSSTVETRRRTFSSPTAKVTVVGGGPASRLPLSVTRTATVNRAVVAPVRVTVKAAPSASPTGLGPARTEMCGVIAGWSLAGMVAVRAGIGVVPWWAATLIVSAFSVSTSSRTRRVVVADDCSANRSSVGESTV